MDLSNLTLASVSASQMALTREMAGMLVMRKVLDMEATQGALLVQMLNQSAGLGRNLEVSA